MAGRSDVKAFNFSQGDSAAVVGPDRTRIRQVVIFGNAAGAVTIKDGSVELTYWFKVFQQVCIH